MHNTRGEIMTDYTAKVESGIALLDAHFGKGVWRKDIDLDSLDLGDCGVCVLGQLFGDYSTGLDALDIGSGYSYGFDTSGSMRDLTAAWKEALGKNNVLVEKGDVYKDNYGYAVKVVQTHLLQVDGESVSAYIVQHGTVNKWGTFTGSPDSVDLFRKSAFEPGTGSYVNKVVPFQPKKGMFVTNAKGQNFYMVSDDEVRELKDGAYSKWLADIDAEGLREMTTGLGVKFSEIITVK